MPARFLAIRLKIIQPISDEDLTRYAKWMERPAHSRMKDQTITVLAVVGGLFLVGHATPLLPYGWASGWASAAALAAVVLAYAILTGPGRRSGASAFLVGGFAILPLFILWFAMMLSIDSQNWYSQTFNYFQVGLSDRGWGHAAPEWLVIWSASNVLIVAMAVGVRTLNARPEPNDTPA